MSRRLDTLLGVLLASVGIAVAATVPIPPSAVAEDAVAPVVTREWPATITERLAIERLTAGYQDLEERRKKLEDERKKLDDEVAAVVSDVQARLGTREKLDYDAQKGVFRLLSK